MRSAAAVCALATATAAAAIGVASCYRAPALASADSCAIACGSGGACPAGRTCTDGFCLLPNAPVCDPSMQLDGPAVPDDVGDGDTRAIDSGVSAVACTAGTFGAVALSGTGETSYTTGNGHVAYLVGSTTHYDGSATVFGLVLPRLAAGGADLFLEDSGGALMHASFAAGSWSAASQVAFTGISTPFFPGTVSATTPRHMIVSSGTSTFFEGIEDGNGHWAFTALPAMAGLAAFREPSLSSDGLRVVFIGNATGGAEQLYVATRSSLADAFGIPRSLFDFSAFSGKPHGPFLSSTDCDALYFDNGSDLYRVPAI